MELQNSMDDLIKWQRFKMGSINIKNSMTHIYHTYKQIALHQSRRICNILLTQKTQQTDFREILNNII